MSSSSPLSSVSATRTPTSTTTTPPALTTPFVPPPGCSYWTPLRFDTSSLWDSDDVRAILVPSADPSCYPSGTNPSATESQLYYSPGVCPSGWTYNDMAERFDDYSSARCCQSGFTMNHFEFYYLFESPPPLDCFRSTTDTNDGGVTIFAHEAWQIAWAASDTSSLSPEPPTLTSSMWVPTWTPGEVIPDGLYDIKESESSLPDMGELVRMVLMVGAPIIAVVGLLCVLGCIACCVTDKKKRRGPMAVTQSASPQVAPPQAAPPQAAFPQTAAPQTAKVGAPGNGS